VKFVSACRMRFLPDTVNAVYRRLLAVLVATLCAASSTATASDELTKQVELVRARVERAPLTLFLAKGGPNACGNGCDEWIAAEGTLNQGASVRLQSFLNTLARRDLPIFLIPWAASAMRP
jgi:hypothetical protein